MKYDYYRNKRTGKIYKVVHSPYHKDSLGGMRSLMYSLNTFNSKCTWEKEPYSDLEQYMYIHREFKFLVDDFQVLTQEDINILMSKRRLAGKLIR
jgi:hypothetical protein